MPVRIVEWQLPYTWGTGIEIDTNKVISLLLREENNLIMVNDENEVYTDLQLASWLTPQSDFPVWVTTGKVLEWDGRPQSWLMLNWKTTSWDYARWIYANDWKIYFDNGTGTWKQVYYSSEVDNLIQTLRNYVDATYQPKLTAWTWINIDSNNVISNSLPWAIVSATAPSNPVEWQLWYDTTNDILKTYDGTNWNEVGTGWTSSNTKTFTISSTSDLTNAQAALDWYLNWWNPILYHERGYTSVPMPCTYHLRETRYRNSNYEYVFVSPAWNWDMENWEWALESDTIFHCIWLSVADVNDEPWDTVLSIREFDIKGSDYFAKKADASDIVYATQAEYNALLPWAESDNKHYFIYSTDGGWGWQPWANTLVYYEFNNSLSDSSGNNIDLTNQWTISYTSNPNAVVLWSSNYLYATSFSDDWEHDWTLNVWVNITSRSSWPSFIASAWTNNSYAMVIPCISSGGYTQFSIYWEDNIGTIPTNKNTWYNIVYTYKYSTMNYKTYVNWVKDLDGTLNQQYSIPSSYLYIWAMANELAQTDFRLKWELSKYILEDKERDATEISDYFDLTKWDYWIS